MADLYFDISIYWSIDRSITWYMNAYWSFVWTAPALSLLKLNTHFGMSTILFCSYSLIHKSQAITVPVRPVPGKNYGESVLITFFFFFGFSRFRFESYRDCSEPPSDSLSWLHFEFSFEIVLRLKMQLMNWLRMVLLVRAIPSTTNELLLAKDLFPCSEKRRLVYYFPRILQTTTTTTTTITRHTFSVKWEMMYFSLTSLFFSVTWKSPKRRRLSVTSFGGR